MEGVLRKVLLEYNKTNLNTAQLQGYVDIAVGRAEKLDVNPSGRWPENPGTHVYKLVRAIRDLETGR